MSDPEPRVLPELWIAVTPIEGRTCGLAGCDEEVAAVQTMLTSLESGKWAYNSVWACANHERELPGRQELMPTCRAAGADATSPCGAAATHVAIAGVPKEVWASRLRAVCVCARHAEEVRDMIAAGR